MKRKPKFHVGQVICWHGSYVKITERIKGKLYWSYRFGLSPLSHGESELRPLTKREAGR